MSEYVGKPVSRVDGKLKVTGHAKYSGDFNLPRLAHGVIFQSTIPSGRVASFNLWNARAVPGVIAIMTHENAPKVDFPKEFGTGESFVPLQNAKVFYNGQAIGVVIAETLEAAQEAARLVQVHYAEAPARLDFAKELPHAHVMKQMPPIGELNHERGKPAAELAKAPVKVESVYSIPIENHNPIEPSATVASWENGELKVYDATQANWNSADLYSKAFRIDRDRIEVITKFVGGAFGCKGSMWPHQFLALMAAKLAARPVKLVLTREQMFTTVGHRPATVQKVSLGAARDGSLLAIQHETINNVAVNKDYSERSSMITPMLYRCENVKSVHKLVPLNYQVPTFMRAPGFSTGSFALESAMDELAYRLKLDPVALRLKNHAEEDGEKDVAFTSKTLKGCYEEGAKRFGWNARPATTGTRRDGDWLVGYGMATAVYPAHRFVAKANVELGADGRARVASATQDIGTGTYTIMAQLTADGLGVPIENVDVDLGDSRLPQASVSGGSTTAASVGTAIAEACGSLRRTLFDLAQKREDSPLHGARFEDIGYADGALYVQASPSRRETLVDIVKRSGQASLTAEGTSPQDMKEKRSSKYGFGAQFAEVGVHSLTGELRVRRMVGAFACGKILNEKTARSQFMGGMVFGLGMALMEHTVPDLRSGRLVTKDLADYHVPVSADVPPIDVLMLEERDAAVNPIGVKGIGEIGIVGVAAAVANAAYNATGFRIRHLPLTPEKFLARQDLTGLSREEEPGF